MKQGRRSTPAAQRAETAFAMYCKLGDQERSLSALRKYLHRNDYKVSMKTLGTWSSKYNWQERLIALQNKANETAAKQLEKDMLSLAKTKLKQLKITRIMQGTLLSKLQAMRTNGTDPEFTYKDLIDTLKHEFLLVGGMKEVIPQANPMNAVQVNISNAGQSWLKTMMKLPADVRAQVIRAMDETEKEEEHKPPVIEAHIVETQNPDAEQDPVEKTIKEMGE